MTTYFKAAAIAVLALLAPSGTFAADYDFDLNGNHGLSTTNPLKLKAGDTVRFVIDENPSTGY